MSPLALPFVPSLHLSGEDNYALNESPFIVSFKYLKLSLRLSPSFFFYPTAPAWRTTVRVNGSTLTSYLQDSCLSNAKSIALHRGEVRAPLTITTSHLTPHLPGLQWAIKERGNRVGRPFNSARVRPPKSSSEYFKALEPVIFFRCRGKTEKKFVFWFINTFLLKKKKKLILFLDAA